MIVVVPMMMMPPTTGRISPRFGIEWRLDIVNVAAEALDHCRDHVIDSDADAVAEQLDGKVTVAEVPGNADQLAVVVGVDFQQRFGFGFDPDHPGFGRQAVAVTQPHGLRQVEQNIRTALRLKRDTAAVAAVEVDQDTIGFARRVPVPRE